MKLTLEWEKEPPVQAGIVMPALIDKPDRLTLAGTVADVDDHIVADHFSPEQFNRRILLRWEELGHSGAIRGACHVARLR